MCWWSGLQDSFNTLGPTGLFCHGGGKICIHREYFWTFPLQSGSICKHCFPIVAERWHSVCTAHWAEVKKSLMYSLYFRMRWIISNVSLNLSEVLACCQGDGYLDNDFVFSSGASAWLCGWPYHLFLVKPKLSQRIFDGHEIETFLCPQKMQPTDFGGPLAFAVASQ